MKIFFIILCLFSFRSFAASDIGTPILVDHAFAHYKLSVSANAYTEKGIFYFYPEGENLKKDELLFEIKTTPQNLSEPILKSIALQAKGSDGKYSYSASLPFTEAMIWNVVITVKDKQNGNILTAVTLPIEVTKKPQDQSTFALYMLPFLLAAFIWVRISRRKKREKSA